MALQRPVVIASQRQGLHIICRGRTWFMHTAKSLVNLAPIGDNE